MAKAVINLQKESGGIVKISPVDGTGVTELVVPESGNLVSVDTVVTDNTVARYDGTTGKLQDSGVVIDDSGNVGISTSSPVFKLDVTGGTENGIRYTNGTIGNILGISGTAGQIGTTTYHNVELLVGSTPKVIIDTNGNLLLPTGTGALGYGAGAGGIVTQLTSKSTSVTLNKPTGQIIMHNATLAAGATVIFPVNNNLVSSSSQVEVNGIYDTVMPTVFPDNYRIDVSSVRNNASFVIRVTNIHSASLSDALVLQFSVKKGATS